MAAAMIDLAGYRSDLDLRHTQVLEPAAGQGVFVLEILKRLHESSLRFGFSFEKTLQQCRFFELDSQTFMALKAKVERFISKVGATLPDGLLKNEDFLLADIGKFDLVVGNPPYIRFDNIPSEIRTTYAKLFATFRFRSDLYICFFEKALKHLSPAGQLTFICANRWLKNQYGKPLRKLINAKYALESILDLEDTHPFEENVNAYPAVISITNQKTHQKTRYQSFSSLPSFFEHCRDLKPTGRTLSFARGEFDWIDAQGAEGVPLVDQGFAIGIGVATGCDEVFIRKDFVHEFEIERELLLPILGSKDLKNDKLDWGGNYIISPYSPDGNLIDLKKYPRAEAYFERNRPRLMQRHVARKNPKHWFRTIDRIRPELLEMPKILLPDISANQRLFIDEGSYYPHHNIYYITSPNLDDLKVMAAMLMTDFVRNQLETVGNKMNGGYPRWQSQNLRKLRFPLVHALPSNVYEGFVEAYEEFHLGKMNRLMEMAIAAKATLPEPQLSLFG